jgi:hypothetical protein
MSLIIPANPDPRACWYECAWLSFGNHSFTALLEGKASRHPKLCILANGTQAGIRSTLALLSRFFNISNSLTGKVPLSLHPDQSLLGPSALNADVGAYPHLHLPSLGEDEEGRQQIQRAIPEQSRVQSLPLRAECSPCPSDPSAVLAPQPRATDSLELALP